MSNSNIKNVVANSARTGNWTLAMMKHTKNNKSHQPDENDIFHRYTGMRYEEVLRAIIYLMIQKGVISNEQEFHDMMDAIALAKKLSEE